MSDNFRIFFFIYAAGYFLAFLIGVAAILPGLFTYNSVHKQNFRLLLIKFTLSGRTEEIEEPEAPSFLKALKEFGLGIVVYLFNSFLSWIQIALVVFLFIKETLGWLLLPSAIRLARWKIKHVPFQRAEDFIKFSQTEGFATQSQQLLTKTLQDLSVKSESLTRMYAENVFKEHTEKVEKYVNEARRLTKEENDSVVIHPRFWAIPQDELHAGIAIKSTWDSFSDVLA